MEFEKVIEEIKQENKWRQKDFANMKLVHESLTEKQKNLFLRMTIPYLYAHWEGFTIDALKKVINYLNKLRLEYNNVKINIFVLSLNDKFNYLKSKQSFAQKCEFSNQFIGRLQNELKFEKKNINTKSNLKFDVLLELLNIFGIDNNRFKVFEADLNKLVNIRNSIAHGENSYVLNLDNFEKYANLVRDLIINFEIEIKEYLENQKYLKSYESGK